MNKITHPIDPEELMAFLDGGLPAARAAATAAHLSDCEECKELVDGLKNVSHALKSWHVHLSDSPVPVGIASALAKHAEQRELPKRAQGKTWSRRPTIAWGAGLATAAVLIIAAVSIPVLHRSEPAVGFARVEQYSKLQEPPQTVVTNGRLPAVSKAARGGDQMSASLQSESPGSGVIEHGGGGGGGGRDKLVNAPMIIRTSDLQLISKEFDKARAELEAILKKHHGYVGDLKVGAATGIGRTLNATLRVPSDQLDSTSTDLKTLGRVASESQSGQDVTSRYVDLQARLANSRNTEKRLTDILNQRTGKLKDVLDVEEELDRVRGEIEEMEAEKKQMTKQVSFATLNVTITEDYKSQLEIVPPSTATRLSNAAVEGYRSMVDGVISVALFALSNGPSLVLWVAVLFMPARFAWRLMRRRLAQ